MSKSLFALVTFVFAAEALAAGGGHGHVPYGTITTQAINVVILFAGIIYFFRKNISAFFLGRKDKYLSAAAKSEEAKKLAEQKYKEIEQKLNKLVLTKEESLSRAKAEAADLKNNLINEAELLSKKIKEEATQTASFEVEKAKKQIREQMIVESTQLAQSNLKGAVGQDQQKQLQGEFIQNMQAVQR